VEREPCPGPRLTQPHRGAVSGPRCRFPQPLPLTACLTLCRLPWTFTSLASRLFPGCGCSARSTGVQVVPGCASLRGVCAAGGYGALGSPASAVLPVVRAAILATSQLPGRVRHLGFAGFNSLQGHPRLHMGPFGPALLLRPHTARRRAQSHQDQARECCVPAAHPQRKESSGQGKVRAQLLRRQDPRGPPGPAAL